MDYLNQIKEKSREKSEMLFMNLEELKEKKEKEKKYD